MAERRSARTDTSDWNPRPLLRHALFADLVELFQPQRWPDWPDVVTLSASPGTNLPTDPDDVPNFVRQPQGQAVPALAYERHVTVRGEVLTRERNWHDLFNALAWWLFPLSRRRLSAAHVQDASTASAGRRSCRRDALTLFDECGVVLLATADSPLPELHAAHRWHDLFVTHRAQWGPGAAALVLGHGLYEQCLTPYIGLTGKAVWLTVDDDVLALPLAQRYATVDRALAEKLAGASALHSPRDLLPLPVLGVPGWWPANQRRAFYANERYFRPVRSG